MTTDKDTEALIERLQDGVMCVGMHDDNSTELFDIEDANDVMADAATTISAQQDRIKELERSLNVLREGYNEAVARETDEVLYSNELVVRINALEAERDEFRSKLAEASGKQKVLSDKLAEAMDALGSPDEWADKRKELEGWAGSAWLAGEGDEDLRSECYSFLCGLFGWLHAAETASRALMQKMEGTDANNG